MCSNGSPRGVTCLRPRSRKNKSCHKRAADRAAGTFALVPVTPSDYELGKATPADSATRWFPGRNLVTSLRYRGRDYRYRALFDVLRRHCRGRVLDVGGGSFVTTAIEEHVQFREWTIVEPHEADLPAVTDTRVRTMVGDGHALEIEGNQFDTVLSIQVLEHVFEPIR